MENGDPSHVISWRNALNFMITAMMTFSFFSFFSSSTLKGARRRKISSTTLDLLSRPVCLKANFFFLSHVTQYKLNSL